jgi:hypothetical protein
MTQDLGDHVWFDFEQEVHLLTQNEYGGVRLQFRSGLGTPPEDKRRAQIINLDIGTGDPVTPGAQDETTPMTLGTRTVQKIVPREVCERPGLCRSKQNKDLFLYAVSRDLKLPVRSHGEEEILAAFSNLRDRRSFVFDIYDYEIDSFTNRVCFS